MILSVEITEPDKFTKDKDFAIRMLTPSITHVLEFSVSEWKMISEAVDKYIKENFI